MNILFYTRFVPDATFGGIERVSTVLCEVFRTRYRYNVYCIVPKREYANVHLETPFNDIFFIDPGKESEQIEKIIQEKAITVVISQYANDPFNCLFGKIKTRYMIKLITAYHWMPGCEMLDIRNSLARKGGKIKRVIKKVLKPVYLTYCNRKINRSIRNAYIHSDRYVLLSERFKEDFLSVFNIRDNGLKLRAIGNPLSFSHIEDPNKKLKQVLIVSRHEESQKRLMTALQIWKKLMAIHPSVSDWQLVLVGEGPDTGCYKRYVCENQMRNVIFVGKQDPRMYYRTARIFMMTSLYEGFGVTLTEAQQYKVVPVVFDSFSSVHDIITHEKNGILIRNNDLDRYVDELYSLMTDENKYRVLAEAGEQSCKKFSRESIAEQWNSLFHELI